MKIRIKGNSIRMRLTKTDVSRLCEQGCLREETVFPNNRFVYALQKADTAQLSASFASNTITILVPASFLQDWPVNDITGLDARMPISETESLYLLIEKDFVCLDHTTEDQSDNYENPNKTC